MSRQLLDGFLKTLVDEGGSDLHLRVGGPPRIRVNGVLHELDSPALEEIDTENIAAEIVRPHLVERFSRGEEVDFAYTNDSGRFRVNAYLQRDSVALVFRQVVTQPKTIPELNLPDTVRRFADEERGLVIIAGPTGSGKTTTLAGMIDHINKTKTVHIVTIEDPIEVVHSDVKASISQRELGADTSSFANAMRAALRQDPDVILVGEMRDQQTVATAITAAETGHLVLSTLHTTDATETMSRIIEFFPPNEQRQVRLVLAGVLKGTVCQRLAPTKDGKGRVPVTEVMVVNGRIQDWILDPENREDVQEIIEDGEYYGMHSFDQSALAHYEKGEIDLRAAFAVASNPHDLRVMMQRKGLLDSPVAAEEARRAARRAESGDGDQVASLVENLTSEFAGDATSVDSVAANPPEEEGDDLSPRRRRSRRRL